MPPLLLLWCLGARAPVGAPLPARGGPVVVRADEADYRAARAPEADYEGVLGNNPETGPGARSHPYRLSGEDSFGKRFVYLLSAPGKAHLLAASVGRRVCVRGKVVDARAGGRTVRELWPGTLEVLSNALPDAPGPDGVFARTVWQPAAALRVGARHYVFRDGAGLARAMGLTGDTAAATASALMARRLRVPAIDWKKHMLVSVSAGLKGAEVERLTIFKVAGRGRQLVVCYRLQSRPGGTPGFGYPAEAVLVSRFDGVVRVEQEAPPGRK